MLRTSTTGSARRAPGGDPGERLHSPGRRCVLLAAALHDLEAAAEDCTEFLCAVTADRQSRTTFGPIRREGGHNDRSTRRDGTVQDLTVGLDVFPGQEVEHGSVMPEVIPADRFPRQEVLTDPGDSGVVANPLTAHSEGRGRDVENGYVREAPGQQPVHEDRRTAADVEYGGVRRYRESVEQFQ